MMMILFCIKIIDKINLWKHRFFYEFRKKKCCTTKFSYYQFIFLTNKFINIKKTSFLYSIYKIFARKTTVYICFYDFFYDKLVLIIRKKQKIKLNLKIFNTGPIRNELFILYIKNNCKIF